MNYVIIFGSISAVLVAFGVFHIYRGVNDSLTNAKIGTVYNFEYLQPLAGSPERYMAKVLEVHRFSDDYISRLNKKSNYRRTDPDFQRSNNLVTAQTFDGKIRNFYAERTRNVRRPLLGGMVFKTGLASLLF
jgi:hypothetical protein